MMKTRKRLLYLSAVFLIALGIVVLIQPTGSTAFVPKPEAYQKMQVREGATYRFPWVEGVECTKLSVGCFKVSNIENDKVFIEHSAFEDADSLKGFGWNLATKIDSEGTAYKLYKFGKGSNEKWIYGVLIETGEKQTLLEFIKLPASSSKNASVKRRVEVDFLKKKVLDVYEVESNEMITLFTSAEIERLFPNAISNSIKVNGVPVGFEFEKIKNLNLPAGKNIVEVELFLNDSNALELLPIYETRKMFLAKETIVNFKTNKKLLVRVRSVGVPDEVWENSNVILFTNPNPIIVKDKELEKEFLFNKGYSSIAVTPIIYYLERSYPVIVMVDAVGSE